MMSTMGPNQITMNQNKELPKMYLISSENLCTSEQDLNFPKWRYSNIKPFFIITDEILKNSNAILVDLGKLAIKDQMKVTINVRILLGKTKEI